MPTIVCYIVCYSFIIAVDYFQARYPGTTVIFDMSVVYIIMAFFAVFANNILVETLSLNTRITFGKTLSKLIGWHCKFIEVNVTLRYTSNDTIYDQQIVLDFFLSFVCKSFIIKIFAWFYHIWVQFETIW